MTNRTVTSAYRRVRSRTNNGVPLETPTVFSLPRVESLIGSNNPKFRMLIDSLQSATGSMTGVRQTARIPNFVVRYTVRNTQDNDPKTAIKARVYKNAIMPITPYYGNPFNPSLLTDCESRAAQQILNRIRGEAYRFSGPTFLGEFHKVVHSIRHPYETLLSTMSSYIGQVDRNHKRLLTLAQRRKGPRKKPSIDEINKMIGKTWLEFVFGMLPLMSDMEKAAKALAEFLTPKPRTNKVFASATNENPWPDQYTTFGDVDISHLQRIIVKDKYQVYYTVGMKAEFTGNPMSAERLLSLSGFRLEEVVPTMWELIPFSWLADYFTNLSDLINNATVSMVNVVYVSHASITECKRQSFIDNFKVSYPYVMVSPFQVTGRAWETTNRNVSRNGGITYPTFRLELPKLPQIANMSALFLQSNTLSKLFRKG